MKPLRAIVFDMDGLMVDSEPLSRQAWDEFLRPYGGQISDAMQSQIIGLRADVSAPLIREAFNIPLSVPEIIAQRAAIYSRIRAQGVPVMPGLVELQAAIAARNIPWAVASSSGCRHVQEILAQLKLTDTVYATACGDEVAHGKPAPDLYLLAAARLGIDPADCLALEDSAPGSQAAIAAGMTVIAIPNGHTADADFSYVHFVYTSLYEVAALLDEWMG
ncbi:MAG TPA: HAD family phosphatase [Chloroflexota bacterium]|nr:HAD family phosphatase [Chloroflexota bacterium]